MNEDLTILVVDDDLVSREKAKTIAESIGECIAVGDGQAAIDTYYDFLRNSKKKLDVILLDFDMPDINGLEVLTEVRRAEIKRNYTPDQCVKVIMTTSFNDMEVVMSCKTMGCNHYILKPVTVEKLTTVLKSLKI